MEVKGSLVQVARGGAGANEHSGGGGWGEMRQWPGHLGCYLHVSTVGRGGL